MTIITLQAVGLCSHFSRIGDRAFRYAAGLARDRGLQLNVFAFVRSPFERSDPDACADALPEGEELERLVVERERRLREYYDTKLGDFLDVGFRVCEGCETVELRRCLRRREFELLVLPDLGPGSPFGTATIEEFATHFLSPVVLVGGGRRRRFRMNAPAELIRDQLSITSGRTRVREPEISLISPVA